MNLMYQNYPRHDVVISENHKSLINRRETQFKSIIEILLQNHMYQQYRQLLKKKSSGSFDEPTLEEQLYTGIISFQSCT